MEEQASHIRKWLWNMHEKQKMMNLLSVKMQKYKNIRQIVDLVIMAIVVF
jgi:hypothetical protein